VILNSCKHAFPEERKGALSIVADQIADNVIVRIADDGIGLTSEADGHHGMGHRLISSFVQQLDGESRFESDGGTAFILSFPHRPPTTHETEPVSPNLA
jgi:two-component sensor histidine kinase